MRAWFQDAFRSHFGSDAEIVVPVMAHASGRLLYRLSTREFTAIGAENENERENRTFSYITSHFSEFGLKVPELYQEDIGRGLALMEDLGEATLLDCLLSARVETRAAMPESVASLYREVVSYLPHFQIRAGKSLDFTRCYPRESFDEESMHWDMEYYRKEYLDRTGVTYDPTRLAEDFNGLAHFLMTAESSFFMYRDFQARNIMVKNGRCGYIDYQGGRRGPLQYDIVSLLYQSRAELPQPFRDELLEIYLGAVEEYLPIDRSRFFELFQGFVLVRLLQVLGTYGLLGLGQGKQYFRDSIPYALHNVAVCLEQSTIIRGFPELAATLNSLVKK